MRSSLELAPTGLKWYCTQKLTCIGYTFQTWCLFLSGSVCLVQLCLWQEALY